MISSQVLNPRDLVPREFVGKARELRTRVAISRHRVDNLTEGVLARIRPRPGFVPMPTKKILQVMPEFWERLQPFGQLGLTAEYDATQGLRIIDLHLAPASISAAHWNEHEPGLVITSYHLRIKPPDFQEYNIPVAIVGLHALGRYWQRTANCDDYALFRDLKALARGALDIVQNEKYGEFNVSTVHSSGWWIGNYGKEDPMLIVRTFLND